MSSYRRYEGDALPPDRLVVKTAEAARALGCHPVTVLKMIRAGRLETVTVGKRPHVTANSLRRVAGVR